MAKLAVIVDMGTIECHYIWYQEDALTAGHSTEADPVDVDIPGGRSPDPNIPCDPHPVPPAYGIVYEATDQISDAWTRHNWLYRVWADCTWYRFMMPPEYFTVEIYLTIDNLTVTVDTNPPTYPSYLFWDPTDPDGAQGRTCNKLRFRLDSVQTMTAKATIRLYPLERVDDSTPTRMSLLTGLGVPTMPNQFEEWTWDGKDNGGQTMPKGMYPFDVAVEGEQIWHQQDQKKSAFLTISNVSVAGEPCDATDYVRVRVYYRLSDLKGRNATWCKVQVYNPRLEFIGEEPAPTTLGDNSVVLTLLGSSLGWGAIITSWSWPWTTTTFTRKNIGTSGPWRRARRCSIRFWMCPIITSRVILMGMEHLTRTPLTE